MAEYELCRQMSVHMVGREAAREKMLRLDVWRMLHDEMPPNLKSSSDVVSLVQLQMTRLVEQVAGVMTLV
jgi:hypothetical protein